MRDRSRARVGNGIVSVAIVVFFLGVHGLLGGLSSVAPLDSELAWIAWPVTAVIVAHIVLGVRISYEKLTDKEKPPSGRKKAKLALRWATGALLGAAICIHIGFIGTYGVDAMRETVPGVACTVALILLLAIHVSLGVKSLVRDLGGSKETKDRLKIPLRGAV